MSRLEEWLLAGVDRCFAPTNDYFDSMCRSADEAFAYSVRSGEVVCGQFGAAAEFTQRVVLDFGCGGGGKTVAIARRGARRVIGVDMTPADPRALRCAREERLPLEFARFRPDGRIDLPEGSVDVVISSSVLEHVTDLPATLAEMRRVLRPAGVMLHRWHPFGTRYGAHLGAALGVPFAHRLFSERALMRRYYANVMKRLGRIPPVLGPVTEHSTTFADLAYALNRCTIPRMHRLMRAAGFALVEPSYFRGRRPVPAARRLPPALREWFVDYELLVCRDVRAPRVRPALAASLPPAAAALPALALSRVQGAARPTRCGEDPAHP